MTNPEWRNGLRPEIADEIEFIISAFGKAPKNARDIRSSRQRAAGSTTCTPRARSLSVTSTSGACWRSSGYKNEHDLKRDEPGRIRRVIAGVVLLVLGEPHPSVVDALN